MLVLIIFISIVLLVCSFYFRTVKKCDKNGNLIYKRTYYSKDWYEYDGNNLVYTKHINHSKPKEVHEWRAKYNDQGKKIYEARTNTYETHTVQNESWYEYDEWGNCTYKKADNYEEWAKYNAEGVRIYFANTRGNEERQEFHENGKPKLIFKKYNNAEIEMRKYDEEGNFIFSREPDGKLIWKSYGDTTKLLTREASGLIEFNEQEGRQLRRTFRHNGTSELSEYDANGNRIYHKGHNGEKMVWKYDDKGNLVYSSTTMVDAQSYEEWMEYDGEKLTHFHNSHGFSIDM